jgi:hypothetical protein
VGRGTGTDPAGALASPWPYRALLAFTFVLVISPQQTFPALAVLRPAMLAASASAVVYLAGCLAQGRSWSVDSPVMRLALALAAWAVLTIPLSLWPAGSFGVFQGLFLKALVVFWLVASVIDDARRLRGMLWCLTLLTIPLGIAAVRHFAAGDFTAGGDPGVRRIFGYDAPLTANPNDLALTLNLVLPLTLALWSGTQGLSRRLLLCAAAALQVLGIVLTFSRGGFLTLAATGLLQARRAGRGMMLALAAAAAAVVVFAGASVLPSGYVAHLGTIANVQEDATGSAQERLRDMGAAASYVGHHPLLGAGLGMNVLALNAVRGASWRMVHNVYLEIAVELALPGLVLYVLLIRAALRSASDARRSSARTDGGEGVGAMAAGIRIALLGFVLASAFHPAAYHFYFYLLAGLAVAASGIAARPRPSVAIA